MYVQGPAAAAARSTLNPVSLVELSVQESVIWLEDGEAEIRLLGAAGTVPVLVVRALATFE